MAFPSNSHLEELLVAYQDGSILAFDEFFVRTKDPLYSFIVHRVRNSEAAQDIIQEAYFRIHRYIASFRSGERKALSWVLSIVQNCIYDYWADQKARNRINENYCAYDSELGGSSEDRFFFKELILQIEKNIEKDELEILLGRLISEFSFDEIAFRKGIRSDNVRQKLSRTLKKVRKIIQH